MKSIDAVSVHEIGRANKGIPEEDQLAFATAADRVLVTYNRGDYQTLDTMWRALGRAHAGIFWCSERTIPRRAIGDLVRALEVAATPPTSLHGLCLPLRRDTGR